MANTSWGTKRNCSSCSTHFYDLNNNPTTCPSCGYSFDPTMVVRPRRGRRKPPVGAAAEKPFMLSELQREAAKKKPIKKAVDEEDKFAAGQADTIEELDDDLEGLDEIEAIEEPASKDESDEETIMEGLGNVAEGAALVDNVEDAEEEEDDEKPKKSKNKKKKK